MSHERRHRGRHQADATLFCDEQRPRLREALKDYCWLLSKGYASPSSLKIVGDKFRLTERQRLLLMRFACTDAQLASRNAHHLAADSLADRDLYIDGFNLLITIESALSGGFIFVGRDGCYRDFVECAWYVQASYRNTRGIESNWSSVDRVKGETGILVVGSSRFQQWPTGENDAGSRLGTGLGLGGQTVSEP